MLKVRKFELLFENRLCFAFIIHKSILIYEYINSRHTNIQHMLSHCTVRIYYLQDFTFRNSDKYAFRALTQQQRLIHHTLWRFVMAISDLSNSNKRDFHPQRFLSWWVSFKPAAFVWIECIQIFNQFPFQYHKISKLNYWISDSALWFNPTSAKFRSFWGPRR
jgi:hypothetical protein